MQGNPLVAVGVEGPAKAKATTKARAKASSKRKARRQDPLLAAGVDGKVIEAGARASPKEALAQPTDRSMKAPKKGIVEPEAARAEAEIEGAASDIEAIFADAKRKKVNLEAGKNECTTEGVKSNKMLHTKKGTQQGRSQEAKQANLTSSSKPRKRTADGFAVYTEEELLWNNRSAGGTKLCPFDCDCCF